MYSHVLKIWFPNHFVDIFAVYRLFGFPAPTAREDGHLADAAAMVPGTCLSVYMCLALVRKTMKIGDDRTSNEANNIK